ncbi:expressed unknown protein [Seminavis robusta]|uniref:Ricin B lectin domain-containing protein n=1 Tax=Seminavis robusta TaxID=568900 RepID=A0A9N8HFX1_9STRA|nr:expressed unknown protein [Seminavis robusta]|eukprot:Sro455_g146480.1 n/a (1741) ;mRNA; r:11409-18636
MKINAKTILTVLLGLSLSVENLTKAQDVQPVPTGAGSTTGTTNTGATTTPDHQDMVALADGSEDTILDSNVDVDAIYDTNLEQGQGEDQHELEDDQAAHDTAKPAKATLSDEQDLGSAFASTATSTDTDPNPDATLTNTDKEDATGLVAHANSIESFQLRAVASLDTLKNQVADARINGDKSDVARATANAIRGSAALVEEAKVKSLAMFADLQEQKTTEESNGWSAQLQINYQSAMAQINRALKLFPKMISYLEGSSRGSNETEQTEKKPLPTSTPIEENQGESMADNTSTYRRGLQDTSQAQTSQEINLDVPPSTSDWNKATSSESRQKEKETSKHRRILRSRFEGNHRAQSHFDRFTKLHDVFQKGDHDGMNRHLGPIQSRATRARSLNQNQRHLWSDTQNAKAQQCEILMGCIGKMSIYDMILFFYSDDIDPNNGKIDDNIYIHTEAPDVYEVYNHADVQNARTQLLNNRDWTYFRGSGRPAWCDRTLRLFSRNVEFGDVPHWEGGTISDVCHAQGGHTYVQLDQIATKVGFKAADEIAKEMFTCSKRLYNSNANPRKSPFPFVREQEVGIDTGASSVDEYGGSSGGVTSGISGSTQDSKSKLFDRSMSGSSGWWKSRDGTKGYPMRLKIRSDGQQYCVDWHTGSDHDYLHAYDCHNGNNQKWYYEPSTKLIRSMHDSQSKCMEAKSQGGNDKVYMATCDSGNSRQRWTKYATHGIKNEGRNKCLDKQSDRDIVVNNCHSGHNQDFMEVDYNDFFSNMIPPSVDFKIQLESFEDGVESTNPLKAIELKWRNGEECPQSKLSLWAGFHGSEIPFEWGDTIVSNDGTVKTMNLLPVSSTAARFRIKCNNPDRRVSLYEILVFGIIEGGNGEALPQFEGAYEESFFVPTGIETENSRDDYGQVKDDTVTLYKYEEGRVVDGLEEVQHDMVGTYKKVWDNWLQHDDDNLRRKLRQTYLSPYPLTSKHYDNSDFYMGLVGEAESNDDIHYQIVKGFAQHHGRSYSGDAFEDREKEYDRFNDKISSKYASVQRGINLVFGKDASVGYICGVDGVVNRLGGDKFPGTCCLDAPFQNPGGEWGREFDCSMTCNERASFFSGLSEESCSAVGGTWCPTATDCSVLKDCVDQEMTRAENDGKLSYKAYLEPGAVENPNDFDDCGDSREYFGYDPLYKNDDDVCANIKQLHNTKDFGFLDEFYSQGSPAVDPGRMGGGGYDSNYQTNANDYTHTNIDTTEWDELFNVDKKWSRTNLVQDAGVSGGLLFALGLARTFVQSAVDLTADIECTSEISSNIGCVTVKNLGFLVLHIVLIALNFAYDVWEFSIAETTEIGNVGPIEAWEILQVQHKNNERMYEGMRSSFEATAKVDNNLEGLGDLVASLVGFLGNDDDDSNGKVNMIISKLSSLEETCQGRRALMDSSPSTAITTIISKLSSLEETCEGRHALMDVSPSTAQNAGCDGNDQDGDGVIDNCEEDKFPPSVLIHKSLLKLKDDGATKHVQSEVFSSTDEAVASVRGALSVVDDCAGAKDLVLNVTVKGISECQAVVSAAPIQWCNDAPVIGKIEEFSVRVDTKPPVISCGFQASTAPDKKILYVEELHEFFDPGLFLQVEDSCSDEVHVDVSIKSNELDMTGPSAILSLANMKNTTQTFPKLFLNQATCSNTQKAGFCQDSPIGSRVYEVAVTATDAAGRSGSDTCNVIVAPMKMASDERELLHDGLSLEKGSRMVEESGAQNLLESVSFVHHF